MKIILKNKSEDVKAAVEINNGDSVIIDEFIPD